MGVEKTIFSDSEGFRMVFVEVMGRVVEEEVWSEIVK